MKKHYLLYSLALFSLLFLSINSNAQIDLDNGLVAHYPFDGNANDSTSNNNNGVLMGAPTLTTDRFGIANRCYRFNGTSDHIIVKKDAAHEPKEAVTISAWVNAEDFSSWLMVVCKRLKHNSSPGNSYLLYAAGNPGSNQNWGFGIAGPSSSNEKFAIDPVVAKTQEWVFLTGTYDKNASDSNVRIYVNGTLIKHEKANFDLQYSDSSLRIGMTIPGAQQFFKGKIDDVRIYNRAINQQEIMALYGMPNVSVNEVSSYPVKIFPNPATSKIFLSGDYNYSSTEVYVHDMTGKLVISNTVNSDGSFDISNLKQGVYFIKAINTKSGQVLQNQKMIVE